MIGCKGYELDKRTHRHGGVDEATLRDVRRELTLKPYVPPLGGGGGNKPSNPVWVQSVPFFHETTETVYVPRMYGEARFGRGLWRDEDRVTRWDGARVGNFAGSLRTLPDGISQQAACDAVLNSLNTKGGAILSLYTGAGKTTCALYVAWRMGLKTAVVVHKDPLLTQWRDRCNTFLPGARVGCIRGDATQVRDDEDVTICMLQSLLSANRVHEGLESFGLVIIDEVHHVAAKVFSQVFRKLTRPYMLGLSATVTRKDRMDKCLEWFVGPVAFRAEMRSTHVRVCVRRHVTHVRPTLNKRQQLNFSRLVTDLAEEKSRNSMILEILAGLLAPTPPTGPSRRRRAGGVLVLSDRRAHCVALRKAWEEAPYGDSTSVLLIGDPRKKKTPLLPNDERALYFGTYSLVAEGVDIPHLDTLVMATPRADVCQAVGRILRGGGGGGRHHEAVVPTVVDVVDSIGPLQAQFRKRKQFYMRSNFCISSSSPTQLQPAPTTSGDISASSSTSSLPLQFV